MANLAIKGHATRGNEVIELLEMLGGKNELNCIGNDADNIYIINNGRIECSNEIGRYKVYTLEEYLEKFPYKVGDKVVYQFNNIITKIKTMFWNTRKEQVFYRLDSNYFFIASVDQLKFYKGTL